MTENPQVRTFTDSYDVEATLYVWVAKKPRGIVQLVHGLGDHARRYDALAEFLVSKGFTVYADDATLAQPGSLDFAADIQCVPVGVAVLRSIAGLFPRVAIHLTCGPRRFDHPINLAMDFS